MGSITLLSQICFLDDVAMDSALIVNKGVSVNCSEENSGIVLILKFRPLSARVRQSLLKFALKAYCAEPWRSWVAYNSLSLFLRYITLCLIDVALMSNSLLNLPGY